MKIGDPFTIKLSRSNYGLDESQSTCPFRKWEYIRSQNDDPFTKSKWGNKRLVVKVFRSWDGEPNPGMSNFGWACTCVRVSKYFIVRWFQIMYYKIKYYEKGNRSRNQ